MHEINAEDLQTLVDVGFWVDLSEKNNRRWTSTIQLLAELPCSDPIFLR